jgi:hypothetical protein
VRANPEGVIVYGETEHVEKIDPGCCKVYKPWSVDKATPKTAKKAVKAFNPATLKTEMVVVHEDVKPAANAGPKTMEDKEGGLHLRRVNEARLLMAQKLEDLKYPAGRSDGDIDRMVAVFGTQEKAYNCDAKQWKNLSMPLDKVYPVLFESVVEVLLSRLHHSGSASTLPKDMEAELKECAEWFSIDFKAIWKKAEEAHPVPKSWSKPAKK